jgi:hypothetical protein
MRKNYPKTIIQLLMGIALVALCAGSVLAQENTVAGNKYSMYFLTLLNNNFNDLDDAGLTHSHVTFTKGGDVDVEMIDGHGLYFAGPGVFAASYVAVGVHMGFETMDVYLAMTGINFNPYIFGVGFFFIDYTILNPCVFYGFQLFDSSM